MFVEQTSFSSAVSEGVHSRIKLCMRLCVRFASTSGGIETGTVRMTLVLRRRRLERVGRGETAVRRDMRDEEKDSIARAC